MNVWDKCSTMEALSIESRFGQVGGLEGSSLVVARGDAMDSSHAFGTGRGIGNAWNRLDGVG